jgi:hypothetical protein
MIPENAVLSPGAFALRYIFPAATRRKTMQDLVSIQKKIIAFSDARDWKQFHGPWRSSTCCLEGLDCECSGSMRKHRERSRDAGGQGNWMPTRLSDEPTKKTSITIICDVQDPFLFLHRRSQRRANMPGCHLFYLSLRLLMSASASRAHA